MEQFKFKVEVNPFIREAIIKSIINDVEHTLEMYYEDVDEWNGFMLDGKHFDIHFDYDEEFSVSIYEIKDNIARYDNSCEVELTIKLNNK
jgi:hypothetical protein